MNQSGRELKKGLFLLNNLKITELRIICEIPSQPSLRSLARMFGETPQNMSKIIKSIEDKTGYKLVFRSAQGYEPTEIAFQLAKNLEKIVSKLSNFQLNDDAEPQESKVVYSFCSRAFMNFCFAPAIIEAFSNLESQVGFRFIDASPRKKEEWSRHGLVDFVLSIGEINLSKEWGFEEIGEIKWAFFSKLNHPVGAVTTTAKIQKYPIILHSHIEGTRLFEGQTIGSKKLSPKIIGTFTETNLAALQIAAKTNQVCFVPEVIVKCLGLNYQVQKVLVTDFIDTPPALRLYAHKDRVKNTHLSMIKKAIKRVLD
jgi:DNA-binding transcriptional LysR family regulator